MFYCHYNNCKKWTLGENVLNCHNNLLILQELNGPKIAFYVLQAKIIYEKCEIWLGNVLDRICEIHIKRK